MTTTLREKGEEIIDGLLGIQYLIEIPEDCELMDVISVYRYLNMISVNDSEFETSMQCAINPKLRKFLSLIEQRTDFVQGNEHAKAIYAMIDNQINE